MKLRRQDKEQKVTELKEMVAAARGLLLLTSSGVGAQQMARLRGKLREIGCPIKVVRNTLLRRVLQGSPAQALERDLVGPLAVLACGEDLVAGAKAALGLESEAPGMRVKVGFLANRIRTREEVAEIANLPAKELLLAQLVFLLQSPIFRVIQALQAPARSLVSTIQAAALKRQEA